MRVSRRSFVKVSGGTLSLFSILPRRLLAGSGETPPSETVRVASIGCAGRPCADINGLAGAGAKIVGLCDVDTRRIDGMRKKYPDAPFFGDYREMLDKLDKQIDAVIAAGGDFIVTPGFDPELVAYAQKKNIPIFPGCTTASEYHQALKFGLELIKFFPVRVNILVLHPIILSVRLSRHTLSSCP